MTRLAQPGTTDLDRRFAPAASVADAVCYEGYVLYPYRASAAKNRFRWQWGVLVPPLMESEAAEPSWLRTELVAELHADAQIHVRVRALHVQARTVLALVDREIVPVSSLDDGETVWTSFDEAVPWQADFEVIPVGAATPPFASSEIHQLVGGATTEPIGGDAGTPRGRLVRQRHQIDVRVDVDVTPLGSPRPHDTAGQLVRLGVTVANETDWADPDAVREDILRRSIAGAHVLVAVDRARLISSLDPPAHAKKAVAGCRPEGLFPVLVGSDDDLALASPIVLYDQPSVAPESGGDMFDATEIDEILALRVRTLTDEEKREARGTDIRAAEVVARCDAMDSETLESLHGTFRPIDELGGLPSQPEAPPFWEEDAKFDPWSDRVRVGAAELGAGARVRLHPRRHADAQDLFVDGRAATVTGVFHDDAGDVHLAVALEDVDPDVQAWHGRYLYFAPEEVEPLNVAQDVPHAGRSPAGAPETENASPRVLVAGVGNIFLGDDGFGVEVVNRIDPSTLPSGVKVADFGIRGVHLAYELLEGYDILVLIDAVSRGAAPGTLSLIEHGAAGDTEGGTLAAMDAHGMDPAAVLAMTVDMGGHVGRTLVLACETATIAEGIGLSDPVAAAVPAAIDSLRELLASLTGTPGGAPASDVAHPAPHSLEVPS